MIWKIYFWMIAFVAAAQTVTTVKVPGAPSYLEVLHIAVVASLALAAFSVAFARSPIPSVVWRAWLVPATAWLLYWCLDLVRSVDIPSIRWSADSSGAHYPGWLITVEAALVFCPGLAAVFICGAWLRQSPRVA